MPRTERKCLDLQPPTAASLAGPRTPFKTPMLYLPIAQPLEPALTCPAAACV